MRTKIHWPATEEINLIEAFALADQIHSVIHGEDLLGQMNYLTLQCLRHCGLEDEPTWAASFDCFVDEIDGWWEDVDSYRFAALGMSPEEAIYKAAMKVKAHWLTTHRQLFTYRDRRKPMTVEERAKTVVVVHLELSSKSVRNKWQQIIEQVLRDQIEDCAEVLDKWAEVNAQYNRMYEAEIMNVGAKAIRAQIEQAIITAVEEEREACAKLIDKQARGMQVLIDHAPTEIRREDLKRLLHSLNVAAASVRTRN